MASVTKRSSSSTQTARRPIRAASAEVVPISAGGADRVAGDQVVAEDAPGQLGEHLSGMAGAAVHVAPNALPRGGGLGDWPDGKRHLGPGR